MVASPEPRSGIVRFRPLTGREQGVLVVLFLILYAIAFGLWVYRPFTETISDLRDRLRAEREKLMAAQAIFHRLDEINARIAELNAAMAELDLLVPGSNRQAHFLYACGQWERLTGARVREMVFVAPSDIGGYEEYMVTFTVVGSYTAQVKFLAQLEGMDRLVRVDKVSLLPTDITQGGTGSGGEEGGQQYATTDVVTAQYVVHLFVDPSKAAQAAAEPPGEGLTFTLSEGRSTPFIP